jgi:hypothetical protein
MRNFEKEALDEIEGSLSGHALSLVSDDEKYRLAILAEVEKINIVVPVLPWPTLIDRARARNEAALVRQNQGPASEHDEPPVEHIALRYLCSLYEAQYQRAYYTTLAIEAPSLLRARVLNAVAMVYPRLADAAKQLALASSEQRF